MSWLRASAGLAQADFGALCAVTKSYVSRLESAQRSTPSDEFLAACADALSVPEP